MQYLQLKVSWVYFVLTPAYHRSLLSIEGPYLSYIVGGVGPDPTHFGGICNSRTQAMIGWALDQMSSSTWRLEARSL